MSSVILKLGITTLILWLSFGINVAQKEVNENLHNPSNLSPIADVPKHGHHQSSQSNSLMDLLLLNSLADIDTEIDTEEPVYFDPLPTGNTPQRSQSVNQTKTKKSHNSWNSGGGGIFANFLCAYCLQAGFSMCVRRYCFVML